jgi:hypothetical protein
MFEKIQFTGTLPGMPLFMMGHLVTDAEALHPAEGVHFDYDPDSQKAVWQCSRPLWSKTNYGDTKIDGYSYNTPENPGPQGPTPSM